MVGFDTITIGKNKNFCRNGFNRSNKKMPLYIAHEEGVTVWDIWPAIRAATELLKSANAKGMQILNIGTLNNYKPETNSLELQKYASVEWYIANAIYTPEMTDKEIPEEGGQQILAGSETKKLRAEQLLEDLTKEPWRDPKQGRENHYDFLIVNSELYMPRGNGNRTIKVDAAVEPGICAVMSVTQFDYIRSDDKRTRHEHIIIGTAYHLGKLYGLESCNKACAMNKQMESTDANSVRNYRSFLIHKNVLGKNLLCDDCRYKLNDYFNPTLFSKIRNIFG